MSSSEAMVVNEKDDISFGMVLGMPCISFRTSLGKVTKRTKYKGICFHNSAEDNMRKYITALIEAYEYQHEKKFIKYKQEKRRNEIELSNDC